jgi:putative Holliday junction resolvase
VVIEVGNVMRVMGLDVGDKTIGIAISDELGLTAQGYPTVIRRSWRSDLDALKVLAAEGRVELVIVGHPLNMDGTEGPRAKITREFLERSERELGIPHRLWDERLSSAEAERVLLSADVSRSKRKEVIDMLAAQVILQSWLEATRIPAEPGYDPEPEPGGDEP